MKLVLVVLLLGTLSSLVSSSIHLSSDAVLMRCYHTSDPGCNRRVFSVIAPHSGSFDLLIHHSTESEIPTRLTTNGAWHKNFQLSSAEEGPFEVSVDLNKGVNVIEVSNANYMIKAIEVIGAVELAYQGATLPYEEIEAEKASTNGVVIGPDFSFTHLPSEASMRVAVQLSSPSQYVEFTTTSQANAMSVRFSIPDSPSGGGIDTPLSILIDGTAFQTVTLTSAYSWYYGSYPFTKNPGDGKPHHFYDEFNLKLDKTYPAGTKFRLQPSGSFVERIKPRTSFADTCNATSNDEKHDCGFSGITEAQCEAKSCCWAPNPPPNNGHIPDCFFPIPAPPSPPGPPTPTPAPTPAPPGPPANECNPSDDQKHDCGFNGINSTQCLVKNCCWKPNPPPNNGHIPDCFFPVTPTPPTPPGPPGPPSPPTPTPPTPPPGTVVITIDLADFYLVGPPAAQPANSISIVTNGADPTGAKDSTNAIATTINSARTSGQTVWVPEGTFTVTDHLGVDTVTIVGAGPWYSVFHGNRVGIYGNSGGSHNVQVHGLSIVGEVKIRNDGDQVNGVGGALIDSVFGNLWIQHTKCGFWLDGPFDNLLITGAFIRDTTADGINFHMGITNSVVEQTIVRNSGDDGLAMWSENVPDQKNTFRYNTIQTPVLANNIAIYGGTDNSMINNAVYDTITQGGGLHVGNRFNARPLAGTTTVSNNLVVRSGCLDPNWNFGVGAIWFYALDSAINANIQVTNNVVNDSPWEAVHFIGSSVSTVTFDTLQVNKVGSFVFQFQSSGAASATNVVATDVGYFGQYNCGVQFTLSQGTGNSGWNNTHCGWPPASAPHF